MTRCSRKQFLSLLLVCLIVPLLAFSPREMRVTYVPNHFPAQPDNQSLGPVHGGAAVDRAGNVYVSTDTPRGILVFGPDGKYRRCFGPTQIHGLYLQRERDGEYLYAARPNFHEVLKIKTDGTSAWTMGYPESVRHLRQSRGVQPDEHGCAARRHDLCGGRVRQELHSQVRPRPQVHQVVRRAGGQCRRRTESSTAATAWRSICAVRSRCSSSATARAAAWSNGTRTATW